VVTFPLDATSACRYPWACSGWVVFPRSPCTEHLSTLGVGVVAAVLTYSVVLSLHPFFSSLGTRTVHWILTETPYFPVQIVVGLLWGFQLGRRYQHRVMLWTWVVPALAIISLILFVPLPSVVVSGVELTKAEHFFGRGCLPQNHCFEWALTVLLYAAPAYSTGAFAARMLPHQARQIN